MRTRPSAFPAVRGIVPPYLLRHLADSAEPQATAALATLTRDQKQRRRRASAEAPAPNIAAPIKSATTGPSRLISDAGQVERLPGKRVRGEGEPATGDRAVDEAYDGFGATWELFSQA
jgi:hypothetical protein